MGKKRVLVQLFMLLSLSTFSQELFTEAMSWESYDSTSTLVFQDTNQIINWGASISSFSTVESMTVSLNNLDIFILSSDACSGLYCPYIYIFKLTNIGWQMRARSEVRINEKFKINIDTQNEKIIFSIKSGRIGELLFSKL